MVATPQQFSDCLERDLAGFSLTTVYCLKINHGLMGFHPAVVRESSEDDQFIVTAKKAELQIVWDHLPLCDAVIEPISVVLHHESMMAFEISNWNQDRRATRRLPLKVYTAAELAQLAASPGFQWAAGVISFQNPAYITPPKFSDVA